jgi:hypothetical protein
MGSAETGHKIDTQGVPELAWPVKDFGRFRAARMGTPSDWTRLSTGIPVGPKIGRPLSNAHN